MSAWRLLKEMLDGGEADPRLVKLQRELASEILGDET